MVPDAIVRRSRVAVDVEFLNDPLHLPGLGEYVDALCLPCPIMYRLRLPPHASDAGEI